MTKKIIVETEIATALQYLGFTGYFTIRMISPDRYCVTINYRYFGVWDANKHTFVD